MRQLQTRTRILQRNALRQRQTSPIGYGDIKHRVQNVNISRTGELQLLVRGDGIGGFTKFRSINVGFRQGKGKG